jgi:predicted nucleotidyltransferase
MDAQSLKSTPRILDTLKEVVANLPGADLVYLFGSQVDGNVGPMSDWDLAVLAQAGADVDEVTSRLGHEAALALGTERVHTVPLARAPVELAFAVISQGVVLHQRDVATRVEYEATVLSRYGDYLPVLRAQRAEILEGDEHARRVRRYRAALGRTERTLGQVAGAQRESAKRVRPGSLPP